MVFNFVKLFYLFVKSTLNLQLISTKMIIFSFTPRFFTPINLFYAKKLFHALFSSQEKYYFLKIGVKQFWRTKFWYKHFRVTELCYAKRKTFSRHFFFQSGNYFFKICVIKVWRKTFWYKHFGVTKLFGLKNAFLAQNCSPNCLVKF